MMMTSGSEARSVPPVDVSAMGGEDLFHLDGVSLALAAEPCFSL
ncbi:hypothetical protein [Rhizobium sp. P38BS-XIX]|nr:hypothetical protein [Rhizobium sp. P38BS-XIX]